MHRLLNQRSTAWHSRACRCASGRGTGRRLRESKNQLSPVISTVTLKARRIRSRRTLQRHLS